MSVSSIISNILYAGGGSFFNVPFYFIQPQDLLVQSKDNSGKVITYNLNTDYTVNGVQNLIGDYTNGGTVVFNAPTPSPSTILIQRVSSRVQEVLLIDNGVFNAVTLNHVHDKVILLIQEGFIDGYMGTALGPPTAGYPTYPYGSWFKNPQPAPGSVFGWILTNDNVWNAFGPIALSS